MSKILIFAGTFEGRALAEYLNGFDIAIHVCVATEYGEKLLPKGTGITITSKRLDTEAMKALMLEDDISVVVDATHPYAVQVTKNISQACVETNTGYLRLRRDSIIDQAGNCIHVDSIEAAVRYLKNTAGKVLLTTGSKELYKFTELTDYKNRLYARVLSIPKVVEECAELGFEGRNLICMQGPFSKELNVAMLKQIDAEYLVTKESGSAGGFAEKLEAAVQARVKLIVIGRPFQEEGVTYNECLDILMKRFELKAKKKRITLLGIGMGAYENMTIEGMTVCSNADVLIGAERMANTLACFNKPVFVEYRTDEICEFLKTHPEYRNIVVALSGDAGFYSGAAKLTAALKDYELEVLPGISSVVYLCSRLKMAWQDVKFVSTHGRYENLLSAVKNNVKAFSLLGGEGCVNKLCKKLLDYGLKEVMLYLGEQLSYENEKITAGTPLQLLQKEFTEPCSVLIVNNAAKYTVITHGLPDESFIRDKVPMTKEEIRSISISKLKLTRDAVIYDIGAGTGSVSVEMALQCADGTVYAIEKKPEAISLIEQNKRKFGADNLIAVEGAAPQAMAALPAPTHAFIGGSSGNLKAIIKQLLDKNAGIRIVINAITLETISEALQCIKNMETAEAEVVQVSVSKAQSLGEYHMMLGQNPVYIISCTGKSTGCKA